MTKTPYQTELNEWFAKEKKENGLVDIKFFPYADVKTTKESFSQVALTVLTAEKSGRFKSITEL